MNDRKVHFLVDTVADATVLTRATGERSGLVCSRPSKSLVTVGERSMGIQGQCRVEIRNREVTTSACVYVSREAKCNLLGKPQAMALGLLHGHPQQCWVVTGTKGSTALLGSHCSFMSDSGAGRQPVPTDTPPPSIGLPLLMDTAGDNVDRSSASRSEHPDERIAEPSATSPGTGGQSVRVSSRGRIIKPRRDPDFVYA